MLEGAKTITFVRSLLAHAKINGVDTSAAAALPGVQVFTAADIDLPPYGPVPLPGLNAQMGRPVIASDVVRFVGEILAVVVSDDRATGADAAELVMVDYDPLPVVIDPHESLKDETLLFPDAGTNVAATRSRRDESDLFDGCDVVSSTRLLSQRMAPCPHGAALDRGHVRGRQAHRLALHRPRTRPDARGYSGLERPRYASSPRTSAALGAKIMSVGVLMEDISRRLARASLRPLLAGRRRAASRCRPLPTAAMELNFTIGGRRTARCSPTSSTSSPTAAPTPRSARSSQA